MAYEVTANRKRPQSFDELAGQDFVSITLKASIESGRIAHAYLFSGPRGCGKTSTARILAKSLNCERGPTAEPCGICNSCQAITKGASLDVIEIDGASNTSVDNVRQIKDEVLFPPNFSKYKIYIIDEVHMLSNSAFNALLKTIEEPPPYIIFIFATTELHKVPATIRSRCQQFIFRLIPLAVIKERLESAARDLGIKADDDALMWIAREATGSLRDAYTLFDQVASFSEGHIRLSVIQEKLGIIGTERIGMLMHTIAQADKAKTAELVDSIIASGVSVEQLLVDTIQYVRTLLLIKSGVEKQELLGFSTDSVPVLVLEAFEPRHFERMLAILLDVYRNMRYSVNPRYEIELALLMLCDIKALISRSDILTVLNGLKQALVDGNTNQAGAIAEKLADKVMGNIDNTNHKANSGQGFGQELDNIKKNFPEISVASNAASANKPNRKPGTDENRTDENPRNDQRASAGVAAAQSEIDTQSAARPNSSEPNVSVSVPVSVPALPGSLKSSAEFDTQSNAQQNISVPGLEGLGLEGLGLESLGLEGLQTTQNAEDLKARVLTELGRADMILNAMLSKSRDWLERDGKLAIACSSNFEVDKINRESAIINQILQKLLQRPVRIAPYVLQVFSNNEDALAEGDATGAGSTQIESSAKIVEKVFRGTRIGEE